MKKPSIYSRRPFEEFEFLCILLTTKKAPVYSRFTEKNRNKYGFILCVDNHKLYTQNVSSLYVCVQFLHLKYVFY